MHNKVSTNSKRTGASFLILYLLNVNLYFVLGAVEGIKCNRQNLCLQRECALLGVENKCVNE